MIKIYLMDVSELQDPLKQGELLTLVSKGRREKILSYKQMKDRKQSLGAGLLMEKCFNDYGCDINQIFYGENGKPEAEGLYFNLSHSENFVMCAVADRPVGCDIEKVEKDRTGVAEHFFTEQENTYLNQFEKEEKKKQFYRLWTLKESYLKMTGEGLKVKLQDVDLQMEHSVKLIREGKEVSCTFLEWELPDYQMAVCTEAKDCAADMEWVKLG